MILDEKQGDYDTYRKQKIGKTNLGSNSRHF